MGSTYDGTAGGSRTRGLAEQSSRVIEDVRDLGTIAVSSAGEALGGLRDKGADALKAGKKKVVGFKDDVELTISYNPWKSVLIAAGVGAVLGFALRRCSR